MRALGRRIGRGPRQAGVWRLREQEQRCGTGHRDGAAVVAAGTAQLGAGTRGGAFRVRGARRRGARARGSSRRRAARDVSRQECGQECAAPPQQEREQRNPACVTRHTAIPAQPVPAGKPLRTCRGRVRGRSAPLGGRSARPGHVARVKRADRLPPNVAPARGAAAVRARAAAGGPRLAAFAAWVWRTLRLPPARLFVYKRAAGLEPGGPGRMERARPAFPLRGFHAPPHRRRRQHCLGRP
jgi:hypothetical protein